MMKIITFMCKSMSYNYVIGQNKTKMRRTLKNRKSRGKKNKMRKIIKNMEKILTPMKGIFKQMEKRVRKSKERVQMNYWSRKIVTKKKVKCNCSNHFPIIKVFKCLKDNLDLLK
jgi:hypothetical protein